MMVEVRPEVVGVGAVGKSYGMAGDRMADV